MKPILHPEHVVVSTYPDVENIPDVDIYTFMFDRPAIAFIDGPSGLSLSFNQLKINVNRLARALKHEIGIREHDVVCFFSTNHINCPQAIWGVLRLGAVPTCANPTYTERELSYQLGVSGAKYMIVNPSSLDVSLRAAKSANIPRENIIVICDSVDGHVGINELIQKGKNLPAMERIIFASGEAKRRLAFLSFSSGTSGLPKGVMISHANLVSNLCQAYEFERHNPHDKKSRVACGVLPFYHIYGLHTLLHQTVVLGITLVIMPSFDPKVFLNSIKKFQITHLYIVPPILLTLSAQPLSSFEFGHDILEIYSAAAPLPTSLDSKIRAMFPAARLRQAWGMTESAVCLTACPPSGPNRHHSAGILYPSVELVLVDPETLESVPPSEVGEVWVRSPSVTMGYHGNREETRETFDVLGDGSGWMRTGDAATFEHEHGMNWIVIKDRLKEVIKVMGQQVAPAELESLLLSHPKVIDAAVVGRPNEKVGELPWGFVLAKGDQKGLEKELLKWVENKVVRYKRLGGVTFVDKVQKNPSGKILRRVYRDMFKEESAKEVRARL